jgi:hypothetical protein
MSCPLSNKCVARRHCGYVGDGCLTAGRGVTFTGSYRAGELQHCLSAGAQSGLPAQHALEFGMVLPY